MRPSAGPSSSSLAARRSTFPRSEDLLSLVRMNLKPRQQKGAHPGGLWGQRHPSLWPPGQMLGPALMRAWALSPPNSCVHANLLQSCPTLSDPMDCSPPWDSPGKNTGMGCHALLQGIFPVRGLNPVFLHCRQILYHLSHQGSPPGLKQEGLPWWSRGVKTLVFQCRVCGFNPWLGY